MLHRLIILHFTLLVGLLLWVQTTTALPPAPLKQEIGTAIAQAIEAKQFPGAVVLVQHQGKLLHYQAYGQRAVVPQPETMTTDTVFDMASMTKPIVTATCIMKLLEMGKLKLSDQVSQHLPEFGRNGKETITIEHLLLHISGLIADNTQDDYEHGRTHAYAKIDALKLVVPPDTRFIYSDVGYIVLGRIIEKLTGEPLDVIADRWIFEPLGMKDSGYRREGRGTQPLSRFAPTEYDRGKMLRGEVHDSRGHGLACVAGHAGLFCSTEDVLRLANMLLNHGMHKGKAILKPETVRLMTKPQFIPGGSMRTFGWDIDTYYSGPRGDRFPVGLSFGHTGFTGTSLWVDPTSQTIIIILTSRLHPDGKGNALPIRRKIANIVARHLTVQPARSAVRVGIDLLRLENFKSLEGRSVALVTNQTGIARDGLSTIDILHQAPNVKLVALFSPEHGIRGKLDEKVGDSKDERTGLPIYSLYGDHRKPTREQLQGVDILVYDMQDIGCRFYTYISTLGLVLEAAAENKIKVLVLDRPNPLGGETVQGPMLDVGKESFVGWHRLPIRHGMTVGELASLFNKERNIQADLAVMKMKDWHRGMEFDKTGLLWVNPSPNMRSLQAALLYPGVGLLETTNLSVGRGTDRPFEIIGAPWIDAVHWSQELRLAKCPGVQFVPLYFTPTSSLYANKRCQGVSIIIDDWTKVDPLRLGYTLAVSLKRAYPKDWQTDRFNTLLLNEETREAMEKGASVEELLTLSKKNLEAFLEVRKKYLLY